MDKPPQALLRGFDFVRRDFLRFLGEGMGNENPVLVEQDVKHPVNPVPIFHPQLERR